MLTNYLYVIILGAVQGITEFLPISSSGHLVVLHNIFPTVVIDDMTFDVVLHLGTLCAVFLFFFKDIKNIFVGWCKSLVNWRLTYEAKLGWLIILATIPAILAGYFFEGFIESFLRSNLVVAVMLIIIGLFFILTERFAARQNDLNKLNWKSALFVGVAQAIALIPGTSRSGITIIAGMANKLKREAAVRFAFLLSVPVILGANIRKIPPLYSGAISQEIPMPGDIFSFILGFVMSFILGYFTIKYFLKFVEKHSLNIFAYYRFVLAVIILIMLLV